MPPVRIRAVSIVTLILFLINLCPADAFACWWKGLPHENPETQGAPQGAAAPNDGKGSQSGGGDIVYLHNGDFVYDHLDLRVPSRGMNLEIKRTYKAQSSFNGRFGVGWEMNFNKRIIPLSNGDVYYLDGEGRSYRFTYVSETVFVGPPEVFDTLTPNPDGTHTLTKKDGTKYNFSQDGVISEIVDRNNNRLSFSYNALGKLPLIGVPLYTTDRATKRLIAYQFMLTKITDTVGRELTLSYNDDGRLTKITDFTGRELLYSYDDLGHLTAVKNPAGDTINYEYDADRRLRSITDPKGYTFLTNTYNPKGQVIAQTFGDATFYFSYDAKDNSTDFTDREGNTWTYYFDKNGNPTKIIDPWTNQTIMTYDSNNRMLLTSITYPRGNRVKYSYDDRGNLTQIRQKKIGAPDTDDPANDIVTTYTYESRYNQLKTAKDSRGNTTTYVYDYELPPQDPNYAERGNLIKIIYPVVDGVTSEAGFTYNQYGQVLTATDPNANVTKYEYFTQTGYVSKIIEGFGSSSQRESSFTYDAAGNVASITDARGNTTNFEHNSLNQLVKTISPAPFNYVTNYAYDKNGNLETVERETGIALDPWQTTTYTYTPLDQLKTITDDAGYVTTYDYDQNGNLKSIKDAQLNTTTYEYNSLNLLSKAIDALGAETLYVYDGNKNLIHIKDAKSNITSYTYDDFDRLADVTYADTSKETYTFDKAGNLTTKTTRRNDTISYLYDELNRAKSKTAPEGAISYYYDRAGRLNRVTSPTGTISYTYDALNRVTSASYPLSRVVSYEYDASSNRTKLTYPDSTDITYEYDELNRLTYIKNNLNQAVASYGYDALSRRTAASYLNQTQASYTYDNINRLTGLTNSLAAKALTDAYTYDKVGNRRTHSSLRGGDPTEAIYTYDNIYQIKSVDYSDNFGSPDTTYNHDNLGNRLSTVNGGTTTYAPNNLNQYSSVGAATYTYDLNGNLKSDGANTYTYDSENRLTAFVVSAKAGTYIYDAFGRRIQKSVDGTITTYLHDGDQVICEYDGSGALLAKYIYGPGIDEPILMERAGATHYYHFDGLGSVIGLSDSSGNLTEEYSYDIFGNITSSLSGVGNGRYFTGREYDSETGLYYYRARYYSPTIGRFLQTDPIWWMNLYTYVNNNPINWIDPYGLTKGEPGGDQPDPTGPDPLPLTPIPASPINPGNLLKPAILLNPGQIIPMPPIFPATPPGYGPDWTRLGPDDWVDPEGNHWHWHGEDPNNPHGPHWDVGTPNGEQFRVYPGGRVERK